jgi:hypothetical protein
MLVTKLDYLQLLAVEWLRDKASAAGRVFMHAVSSCLVPQREPEAQLEQSLVEDEDVGFVSNGFGCYTSGRRAC